MLHWGKRGFGGEGNEPKSNASVWLGKIMMADYAACENPGCNHKFKPRAAGRKHRFCCSACKEAFYQHLYRAGKEAVKDKEN